METTRASRHKNVANANIFESVSATVEKLPVIDGVADVIDGFAIKNNITALRPYAGLLAGVIITLVILLILGFFGIGPAVAWIVWGKDKVTSLSTIPSSAFADAAVPLHGAAEEDQLAAISAFRDGARESFLPGGVAYKPTDNEDLPWGLGKCTDKADDGMGQYGSDEYTDNVFLKAKSGFYGDEDCLLSGTCNKTGFTDDECLLYGRCN